MEKFIYSMTLILIGLLLGLMIRFLVNKKVLVLSFADKSMKVIRNITLLGLLPIVNLGAFWIVNITDVKFIFLPFLGVGALFLGGAMALAASKLLNLGQKQRGSMFVSGLFTNLGAFGGLFCFMFLGEASYVFVSMYRLFEDLICYAVGFPIAKLHGEVDGQQKQKHNLLVTLLLDPYIMISLGSIILGGLLNVTGLERLDQYAVINRIAIPLISIFLLITIGYNIKLKAVTGYIRECFVIAIIKFVLVPVIITMSAYLLGLGELENGLILKVVIIMSAMPPALTSVIPPQLYKLDVDLANSCWLFNTGALVVVLPIIFIIQTIL